MRCKIAALEPSSPSKLVNTFRGPGGDLASESFSDEGLGLDNLQHSNSGLEVDTEHEMLGVVLQAVPGKALVKA